MGNVYFRLERRIGLDIDSCSTTTAVFFVCLDVLLSDMFRIEGNPEWKDMTFTPTHLLIAIKTINDVNNT